jgi:hypothetical protein
MLLLVMMLLVGLFAAIWGFLACFFPARWHRLVEVLSFGADWTMLSSPPKFLSKTVKLGQQAAGFVIFLTGCWFAYVAASAIYNELTRRVTIHQ